MALVDLHMHSTFSDGRLTPAQLVEAATRVGLEAIAITDHDSWNGIEEAQKAVAAGGNRLRLITGVELGTQWGDVNGPAVHILGLHVDRGYKPLYDRMLESRHGREIRLGKMLAKLKELGYPIEVAACDPKNRAVGRPHVAKALVQAGYFQTVQEVFDKLLRRGAPAYVPQPKLTPQEAVELIHGAGGIAVLAHPSELPEKELAERILSCAPFDGIEVYHPSNSPEDQLEWLALAEKHKLLVSGGSDYHAIPGRFPEELGIWQVEYAKVKGVIEWK